MALESVEVWHVYEMSDGTTRRIKRESSGANPGPDGKDTRVGFDVLDGNYSGFNETSKAVFQAQPIREVPRLKSGGIVTGEKVRPWQVTRNGEVVERFDTEEAAKACRDSQPDRFGCRYEVRPTRSRSGVADAI